MRQIFIGLFCTVVGGVILFLIIEQYVRPSLDNPVAVVESPETGTKQQPPPTNSRHTEQSAPPAIPSVSRTPLTPTHTEPPVEQIRESAGTSPDMKRVNPLPAKPSILQFWAQPNRIERGQSATLHWEVNEATEVSIDAGIGAVPRSGSRTVFPSNTTTYKLSAHGVTAREVVEVVPPPDTSGKQPPSPVSAPSAISPVTTIPVPSTQSDGVPKQTPERAETPPDLRLAPPATYINRFSAEPGHIERGVGPPFVTLSWSLSDEVTEAHIDHEVGKIIYNGRKLSNPSTRDDSRVVRPFKTTKYTLFVKGPLGSYRTSVTVEVQ